MIHWKASLGLDYLEIVKQTFYNLPWVSMTFHDLPWPVIPFYYLLWPFMTLYGLPGRWRATWKPASQAEKALGLESELGAKLIVNEPRWQQQGQDYVTVKCNLFLKETEAGAGGGAFQPGDEEATKSLIKVVLRFWSRRSFCFGSLKILTRWFASLQSISRRDAFIKYIMSSVTISTHLGVNEIPWLTINDGWYH